MAAKTHQDILLMRWALFSVTGIVLIVVLYSVGVTPSWAFALREAMTQAPFLLPPDAPALSPAPDSCCAYCSPSPWPAICC